MTIVIAAARSKWRRIALAGGGGSGPKGDEGRRPAATIREVCLVGDLSRCYRHRPEVMARVGVSGERA